MEVTLYFVGDDADSALEGLPFDSYESASSYAADCDKPVEVYSVSANVDFSTVELCE